MDAITKTTDLKMTKLISFLNDWRKTYLMPSNLHLDFDVNAEGMLTVNDVILCPFADVLIDDIDGDIHEISISTSAGDRISIFIDWEFEEKVPKITQIDKTIILFKAF